MKKLIILFTLTFFVFQVKAQLVKDEWGKIIPFTKTEKYKKKIDSVNIKTFIMPKCDNDSLFNKHNKGKKISEITNEYNSGFVLKNKSFNLKKKETKLKLKEGTLWLYRIEGVTTKGLGVTIRLEQLMEGAYVAIYPRDESNSYFPTRVYTRETLPAYFQKSGSFSRSVDGKSMIIEYFEPENLKTRLPIIIENIVYVFADAIQNFSPTNRNIELKSGAWGDSEYSGCQNDIVCTDCGNWGSEAKSVGYIRIPYRYNNQDLVSTGTCFFVNKEGGYTGTGVPFNPTPSY